MALTFAQIVNLACAIAKAPAMTAQAGQFLTAILDELAQNYDFAINRGTYVFNFNQNQPTDPAVYPNVAPGGGPYDLPADYLRMYGNEWFLQGVPYPMIHCDLKEYDLFYQSAGFAAYPNLLATDMSQTPPKLLVWPPAAGSYQAMVRYFKQPTDAAPSTLPTSADNPWFPQATYLTKRLAAEMMQITDDDREPVFREQCESMLSKYLKMKDDHTDRAKTVTLDRRRFSRRFDTLPNTKKVGW